MQVNSNNFAYSPVARTRNSTGENPTQPTPTQPTTDGLAGSAYIPSDPVLTLGKNLPVGRASADWNQERLAGVEIRFIDGSSVTVENSTEYSREMKKAKDGSIDSVKPSGHGQNGQGGSSMGFDVNDENAPGLTANKGSKCPKVMLDVVDGKTVKQEDFGKLNEGKWAPGGARLLDLSACDTGDWGGLAQTTSRVLPGIQVHGTVGTLLENKLTGSETPAAGPDASRTYVVPRSTLNNPGPGQFNPFPKQ